MFLCSLERNFHEFSKTHPTFVSLELKRQLNRKLKRELNQRRSSEGTQVKEGKQRSSINGAQAKQLKQRSSSKGAQKKKLKRALKRAFRGLHSFEGEESEPCPVGACFIFFMFSIQIYVCNNYLDSKSPIMAICTLTK